MSFTFAPLASVLPAATEVFRSGVFRVRFGVNAGDPLGAVEGVLAGDIYRLDDGARPELIRLARSGPDTGYRVGLGSGIGVAGDVLAAEACHLFMAADGTQAEVLVLRHAPRGGTLLMPLSPLCAGLDYTLIRSETSPASDRLPSLPCAGIVRGSRIMLATGTPCPVEALRAGNMVLTRDHGPQPLRWAGQITLRTCGWHAPVAIAPGTLGTGSELRISQQSRLFQYRRDGESPAPRAERLIPARDVLAEPGVSLCEGGFTDYVFLVFDAHEIVYAEGLAVESLQVTGAVLDRLPGCLAEEIRAQFPGLDQPCHYGREIRPARNEDLRSVASR